MVDPEDRQTAAELLDRILELREKANAHAQSLHYLNNELLVLEGQLQSLQPRTDYT
jgi:hypothetical protein